MDYLLLLSAIVASVLLAIAIARATLSFTFHLMNQGLPCAFHWRPVLFVTAVFWCWYLAPAFAESRAVNSVIHFVNVTASTDQGRTGSVLFLTTPFR